MVDGGGERRVDQPEASKVVRVSRDQVSAARALIRLREGVDKVDPVTAKVASARPRSGGPAQSQMIEESIDIETDIETVPRDFEQLLDRVTAGHGPTLINRAGEPIAVLVSVEEFETLSWLAVPGIDQAVTEAESAIRAGRVYSEAEIRAEFDVRPPVS